MVILAATLLPAVTAAARLRGGERPQERIVTVPVVEFGGDDHAIGGCPIARVA